MDYQIDLHVHSNTNPHAFSTIEENVTYAAEKGMKVIAITNHGPALLDTPHWWQLLNIRVLPNIIKGVRVLKGVEANIIGENGEFDINQAIYQHLDIILCGFLNIRVLPNIIKGVRVLKGVEANIIGENGEFDINQAIYQHLDIILCGFHGCREYHKYQPIEKNTKSAINIIKSQKIDILVHPGNKEFPIDFEEVIKVAKECNVALEINNSSLGGTRVGSYERCSEVARIAKKYGCFITVNTDSHYCRLVGHTDLARKIIEEVDYPEELIINSSEERLNKFLELRKSLRPKEIFDTYIDEKFSSSEERLNKFLELRKSLRPKEIFDTYIDEKFSY